MKFLRGFEDLAYGLLRIMSGFMFAFHGVQKVLGLFSPGPVPFGGQMWIGGVLELVCGLGIMLGWNTRLLAFLASGEMAVAYFQFHWKFQLGENFFPAVNHGELAVLYCFVFFLIACKGSGALALGSKD